MRARVIGVPLIEGTLKFTSYQTKLMRMHFSVFLWFGVKKASYHKSRQSTWKKRRQARKWKTPDLRRSDKRSFELTYEADMG